MFVSALGSISGKDNRLGLAKTKHSVVILVDGLGSENLRAAAGHAPFLNSHLKVSKSINTVFPSTTAVAITSFGTGAKPAQHGILGYSVFDRKTSSIQNMLSGWGETLIPADLQSLESVSARAKSGGVPVFTVGPGEYDNSGFTQLNMSDSTYVAAKTFEDRVRETLNVLNSSSRALVYLYFPELDSTAHAFGVDSIAWRQKLEELDVTIKALVSSAGPGVGLLLTADHGIVDVPRENQILLDELELPGLVAISGDPRNTFAYFETGTDLSEVRLQLAETLDGKAIVATADEVTQAGWLGGADVQNAHLLPDLFIISTGRFACYHRAWCKPQSLRMIGQHGGISQEELSVPLLKFGVYA